MKTIKITRDMINASSWDCKEFLGSTYNLSGNTMFQKIELEVDGQEVEVELIIYSKVTDTDELWEEINNVDGDELDSDMIAKFAEQCSYCEPYWEALADDTGIKVELDDEAFAYMNSETSKFAELTHEILVEYTVYDVEKRVEENERCVD